MAIVGAGAAGSYIGAFLTREGHDVTILDMWGEHVDAMRSGGINVTGCQGPFNVSVNAHHFSDAMQINQQFDIIFLAVKSYDTEWVAHFAKRLLRNDGVVVDNQNCMNDLKGMQYPENQGLYDPCLEHDSCGVGFVVGDTVDVVSICLLYTSDADDE